MVCNKKVIWRKQHIQDQKKNQTINRFLSSIATLMTRLEEGELEPGHRLADKEEKTVV